ncbi:hypothetical protein Ndes2526B_g00086 [Nannochloris sp. 'desiccata']|nr:hypothetical protein KSW81_002901 [Chlorella desiccata (nom. nud.)]KAH7624721.1 putative 50S ribosomal protein L22 [Chlorella desiccata (nom. nud.)]
MSSSLKQLCQAAWSLAARTGPAGGSALLESLLTSTALRSATTARGVVILPTLAAAQPWQQSRGVMSLFPLTRSFHASSFPQEDTAVINPLQQTPSPLSSLPGSKDGSSDGTTTIASLPNGIPDSLTARAILRNVPISPRKLNEFARILRGLHIEDALIQCQIHPKKSAQICEKVLLSARANATNNHGLTETDLKVEEAWVGKGQHMKRVAMHARGRAGKKYKYRSHLTIILKQEEGVKKRTRVLPMMMEREKFWNMREGKPAPLPTDGRWWRNSAVARASSTSTSLPSQNGGSGAAVVA